MKKSMMLFLAVMGIGCAALRADTIATNANCKVAVVAYMNGCLQMSMTGSTALQLTSCDVSIKPHGASADEWSAAVSVSAAKLGPGGTDKGKGVYFSYRTALRSNVDVRFRATDGMDSTEWITWDDVRVEPFPLAVSAYSKSDTARSPTGGLTILANGRQDEVAELDPSKTEFLQLDYGRTCYISGIRIIPRLAFSDRVIGAEIKISDNADMSNAQTLIASTAVAYSSATGGAVDWAFPAIVQGRYVRVTAVTSGKWIDFCELEAYSDRPDSNAFSVTVSQSAYNSASPKIAISADWLYVDSWTVERAFSSSGPWAAVSEGNATMAQLTDASASTTGATYWYRVRFGARMKSGASIEYATSAVSYLYPRCLERDWTAPTTLFSGVLVLADSQMNSSYPTSRAFDGRFDSGFVVTTANPLMGLDLGSACHISCAWVLSRPSGFGINTPVSLWGANVQPENTAGAQTSDDPNHVELSRNTEPGGGNSSYFNHWYAFPVANPGAASYQYAFIHKNASDAAANNWGNVIEITFWGYDEDDVSAAQLIAPERLTASRTAGGIQLAWTPGFNVTGYVLERKAGEDGAWSELGTFGLDSLGTMDSTATVVGTRYYYRVKVEEDGVTKYSPETAVLWYVAGDGTGLLATYSAPAPSASFNPAQIVLGSEIASGINIAKASGEAIYGAAADNVLVAWKGRLIVPIAGDYTFTAEATDGFMLELDGDVRIDQGSLGAGSWDTSVCSVLNNWASTGGAVTTRTRADYTLTAGEHQIRAWWNPGAGAKSCVLKWTLPGETESVVIPVSQLKPAASPDPETYGKEGWRFGTVSNKRGYIAQQREDAFTISEADVSPVSVYQHGAFAWKKIKSRVFTIEADVYAPQMFSEYGGLFISANMNGGMRGDGASLLVYRLARNAGVNARCRAASGAQDQKLLESNYLVSSQRSEIAYNNQEYTWLRIERDGSRFVLKARRGTGASGAVQGNWTTVATYDDAEGRFGSEVYVGFCSTSDNLSSYIYQARYLFTNVRLRTERGMTIDFR